MITADGLHEYDAKVRTQAGPCPECQSGSIKLYHGQDTGVRALTDAECKICGHVWKVLR